MRTPQTQSSGLITVRFWAVTMERLADLNAYFIRRDRVKRWSMVEVLESEIERVYQAYETKGYELESVEPQGSKRQSSMRINPLAWEHLLSIQAHVMLQTHRPATIAQVIHNLVTDGLSRF